MQAFVRRLSESLYALAVTLWVGGLWAIGFMAAPALFASLKDRVLAGEVAGNLFGLIAWVGIACAAYSIAYLSLRRGKAVLRPGAFRPVLAQLKAQAWPNSVMESAVRSRFAAWHGVAGGLSVLQRLLGAVLVLLQGRER
mgnify:CR=1 FL=1